MPSVVIYSTAAAAVALITLSITAWYSVKAITEIDFEDIHPTF